MPTRIENILSRARDTLADPDKERWTDARLLRLLSEAQEDLVIHTELFKATVDIPLVIGQAEYDLPADCYRILRASSESYEIPLESYTTMDENARRQIYADTTSGTWERNRGSIINSDFNSRQITWEDTTGSEIEAVIYDNRDPSKIRFYPIPNDSVAAAEYTFENSGPVVFVGDELYGVVVDIETPDLPNYTFDSVYGAATSFFDPAVDTEVIDSPYGVVTSVNETIGFVKIWYTQAPAEVTNAATDTLSIPTIYDKAMKYYVIANAYDDDHDTANQQKSAKALVQYDRELELARQHSRTDGIKGPHHRTQYRNAFE